MAAARIRPRLDPRQRRFGAHMSIAGGLHNAFERAARVGCDCFQIFVKNQRQWRAPPLDEEDVTLWNHAWESAGRPTVLAHNTYLINLGATDGELWRKSIEAFIDEMHRCRRLGIGGLVTHPGGHMGAGESAGLRRIATAVRRILEATADGGVRILLETTAGQGTSLGYRFEHLAEIIERCGHASRLAVCLDSCHLFAAGYDLSTDAGYIETMNALASTVGFDRVAAVHVNDSLKELGSRRDRHAGIGQGRIGRSAFRRLVNDPRLLGLPMILETPKGTDARGRDLDRVNLAALRRLIHHG